MKKIVLLLACCVFSALSFAMDKASFPLDKIVFQLSAKQWISTQTALLKVNVNATLTNADLVKARSDIMDKLNKIAQGDWHLTQFDRSQDSSGLEKLFVDAQIRLPQANLTNVYQYAKDVSKPGITYTITGIEFKPSMDEIQKIRAELRHQLYQQITVELSELNKVYTNQNYSINRLYLLDGETANPTPVYKARETRNMVMAASSTAPNLAVSNEMIMTAIVEAASNRKEGKSVSNQQ